MPGQSHRPHRHHHRHAAAHPAAPAAGPPFQQPHGNAAMQEMLRAYTPVVTDTPSAADRRTAQIATASGELGAFNDGGGAFVAHEAATGLSPADRARLAGLSASEQPSQAAPASPSFASRLGGGLGVFAGLGTLGQANDQEAAAERRYSQATTHAERREATVDYTGAQLTRTNGGATLIGGAAAMVGNANLATAGSYVAAGAETLQGGVNLADGLTHYDEAGADQRIADGTGQLAHGGLGLAATATSNPVVAAGMLGVGIGNTAVAAADAHAQQTGMFGVNTPRASGRGLGAEAAVTNRTASEAAADDGAARYQQAIRDGHGEFVAHVLGGTTTFGSALGATAASLWHATGR